jgi:hypothetical protein
MGALPPTVFKPASCGLQGAFSSFHKFSDVRGLDDHFGSHILHRTRSGDGVGRQRTMKETKT